MALKDVHGIMDLNEGSIDELFAREWKKLLENVKDPTTEAEAKRRIVIEISVSPSSDRSMAKIVTKAKTHLASIKADEGAILLELNSKGEVVAMAREGANQQELSFPTTKIFKESK